MQVVAVVTIREALSVVGENATSILGFNEHEQAAAFRLLLLVLLAAAAGAAAGATAAVGWQWGRAGRAESAASVAPDEAAMMRALCSKAVPAPGEVLRLQGAGFVPDVDLSGVYIRDCYEGLADVILTAPQKKFILGRLLQRPSPPPFIVWQHAFYSSSRAVCYNTKTGDTLRGEVSSFEAALMDPDTWYIADAMPPDLQTKAHLLLITSPQRSTYKELEKRGAWMLHMPPWSLEELQDCRSKLGLPVSEAFVKKCFQYGGGVVRYSLQQSAGGAAFGEDVDRLLGQLGRAVDTTSVSQVRAALADVAAQDKGPEASHRVIHIMTDGSYSVRQLEFASRWVAERFMAKAAVEDEQGLVSLVNGSDGTFRGLMHEAWMHRTLPKGGEFTIAPVKLTGGTTKLVREAEYILKLPPCKEAAFEEVVELAGERCEEGVYYKPVSACFPLVDSLLRVGGVVNLFQMTVSLNKPVHFAALEDLLGDLGLTPQQEARLIFVVPEDIYPDFKLNVKTGGSRQKKASRPSPTAPALVPRPKLCIMRAPRAQVGVRR
ncbi:hypothetical protein CHLRE_12g559000v5 [Chlamydomonas reinhardtii]|uniref:Uncharacterized protein n=1 Tax=Chlamydomonas reinhardtii TaxID=3055 RepID=A0A2K3D5M4_CHLRE|nr:uncharacterized protein CHLRE_12g559000v5 [Chlamydomonas reinhardtii]PNW75828.1 hypothetical protein CHLRE_12g559000v5 [Chlamydomonas reinhardtii]